MTAAKNSSQLSVVSSQVLDIPVEQLVVSPQETRRTIDQAALNELADSIREKGVIEALLVRPVDLDCMSGEALSGPAKAHDAFEIIAGQRRWLASKLAEKKTCPCIVRELTDEEAAEQRIISNLQRKDLTAMEEAEAYAKLLDRPGATIETVAAALAKSPSYVGRRLKLLDAIEPVREALKYGAIEVGHALELARLSERQQRDLLAWLEVGYDVPSEDPEDEDENQDDYDADEEEGLCKYCEAEDDDLEADGRAWSNEKHTVCSAPQCVAQAAAEAAMGGWKLTRETVAELRKRIAQRELHVLSGAPFLLDDEIPPMACTACPKRAAGAASLFADIAEDTCTDPECYQRKLQVWVKAELETADREKQKLVMLYDGHAQGKAGVSRWDCVINGDACASQEEAIWVSGRMMGHRARICRDKKCAVHFGGIRTSTTAVGSSSRSASRTKPSPEEKARAEAQAAERKKLAERLAKERAYREALFAAVAGASPDAKKKAADDLAYELSVDCLERSDKRVALALGWPAELFDYGNGKTLAKRVRNLDVRSALHAAALALCAVEVVVSEYGVLQGKKPERMEQIARWLGIDVEALRGGKPAKADAKPVAKKAAKAATKPAPEKAVLSADAKKRIAAAQKKRWAAAKKGGAR